MNFKMPLATLMRAQTEGVLVHAESRPKNLQVALAQVAVTALIATV